MVSEVRYDHDMVGTAGSESRGICNAPLEIPRSDSQTTARINPQILSANPINGEFDDDSVRSQPSSGQPLERYVRFPTESLPEPVRSLVEHGAKSIGCDEAYFALPALAVLGAAIGDSRRITPKRGWAAPAILWTVIVGESGTLKSPAFRIVLQATRDRERKSLNRYTAEVETYQAQKEAAKEAGDDSTCDGPSGIPKKPRAKRYLISDATVASVAPILHDNPRGVLLARDELAGWMGSFGRYSSSGSDASNWLSMYGGDSFVVDRKTGVRTIYVSSAHVSICGGVQPDVLHRLLRDELRASGLAARLLMAYPPRIAKKWSEAEIAPKVLGQFGEVVDRLYELEPDVDEDGERHPLLIELTPEAKKAWIKYYQSHAAEQVDLNGDLAAAWSKLEETPLRLALIIHCVRVAASDTTLDDPNLIDVASMTAGIRLAEWCKRETRRIYALLDESEGHRKERTLLEWVERKGGSVTAREAQQFNRRFRTIEQTEAALQALVDAGYGRWDHPSATRGRPTRHFVLVNVYDNETNHGKNVNIVDVDIAAVSSTASDGAFEGPLPTQLAIRDAQSSVN